MRGRGEQEQRPLSVGHGEAPAEEGRPLGGRLLPQPKGPQELSTNHLCAGTCNLIYDVFPLFQRED